MMPHYLSRTAMIVEALMLVLGAVRCRLSRRAGGLTVALVVVGRPKLILRRSSPWGNRFVFVFVVFLIPIINKSCWFSVNMESLAVALLAMVG